MKLFNSTNKKDEERIETLEKEVKEKSKRISELIIQTREISSQESKTVIKLQKIMQQCVDLTRELKQANEKNESLSGAYNHAHNLNADLTLEKESIEEDRNKILKENHEYKKVYGERMEKLYRLTDFNINQKVWVLIKGKACQLPIAKISAVVYPKHFRKTIYVADPHSKKHELLECSEYFKTKKELINSL
jgi:hypothetical protein